MNKYHDLAEQARSAVLSRRRNDAALMQQITNGLPTPAELQAGKVAENDEAENTTFTHETKASCAHGETGCLVDPNNTPPTTTSTNHTTPQAQAPKLQLRDLLKTPEVQKRINDGQAQRRRDETRKATMRQRAAVPVTPWKRTTQEEKFRYAGHAADHVGGQAFSLNLSEKTQKKLRRHRDPLRAFTDTLNRELKRHGLSGMPYALALEESTKDKLHVHGFLIPPAGSATGLRNALRAAGGAIAGKAAGRQLTLKGLSGGAGWAFYCRKDLERTNGVLEGNARLFLNRAMTQAAREFSLSV